MWRRGWDAYVQSRCDTPATLRYSLDGGETWAEQVKPVHPAEWTVRVPHPAQTFCYQVLGAPGEPVELRAPEES